MSLYTWRHQGPCKPSSCHLHTQPSLGQGCHREKRLARKVALVGYNSLRPCGLWPVRLLCQGFLQARIVECIGQYWWPIPLSVQVSSVAQPCSTLCNPMNRITLGLPVHHQLLEFTQTHVHRVSDAIQPSCPLSSPLLLPAIPRSIRVFSNESILCIRWPKNWSFSFSISPSNEYSGLIFFRMDWFDLLTVKGILNSLL